MYFCIANAQVELYISYSDMYVSTSRKTSITECITLPHFILYMAKRYTQFIFGMNLATCNLCS